MVAGLMFIVSTNHTSAEAESIWASDIEMIEHGLIAEDQYRKNSLCEYGTMKKQSTVSL